MKRPCLSRIIASFAVLLVVAPTAYFFTIPAQRAEAFDFGAGSWAATAQLIIANVREAAAWVVKQLQWIAEKLDFFNKWVLQPLAVILSGKMLQQMTANIISNVTGGAINGTGMPQFVQNLGGHRQKVGTNQAEAYFQHYRDNSTSVFKNVLVSSLRQRYYQNSSLDGFFAANKDTFVVRAGSRANADAFLAGKWSKGGVGAWFALTTQDENNPYMLYQNSRRSLSSQVADAEEVTTKMLDFGKGFLSFCGKQDPDPVATAVPPGAACDPDPELELPCGSDALECNPATNKCEEKLGEVAVTARRIGKAPGDLCKRTDGSFGEVKTPGSVIEASLNKALALGADKTATLGGGTVSSSIISALKSVQTILTTVDLAKQILGSADNDRGLVGSGQAVQQEAGAGGYLGVTPEQIEKSAPDLDNPDAGTAGLGAADMQTRLPGYESSWGIIRSSTEYAADILTDLAASCAAQADAANEAMGNIVEPLLAQADAADSAAAEAEALLDQIELESSPVAGETGDQAAARTAKLKADLAQLKTMPPTAADAKAINQETKSTGEAVADPEGSLNVSGGTFVDQLALLAENAVALKAACQ